YPDDALRWRSDALYPYDYARGVEFGLHPHRTGKGTLREGSGQQTRLPQHIDPAGFVHELSAALHVWRRSHYRNALPDSGYWLCRLPGYCSWRYSLRHVLHDVPNYFDSGQSASGRYYVRGGRPSRASQLTVVAHD